MELTTHYKPCEICGEPKGGIYNHDECAKILQKGHEADKHTAKVKTWQAGQADEYVSNMRRIEKKNDEAPEIASNPAENSRGFKP